MKVIFNYATRQFESMEPTLRERFALGGGVIQGDRKNFQSGSERGTPEYIENIIKKARDALPKGKRNYLTTAEFAKLIGF